MHEHFQTRHVHMPARRQPRSSRIAELIRLHGRHFWGCFWNATGAAAASDRHSLRRDYFSSIVTFSNSPVNLAGL